MVGGSKRTAAQEPQSRRKKTRTAAKTARSSNVAGKGPNPTNEEVEDFAAESPLPEEIVDETITVLGNIKLSNQKEDEWPKQFGKRVDDEQAELLAALDAARKKLESEKAAFKHGILPLLRMALAPIDSQEAPEVKDESTLEVAFVAAGHQEYIVEITQLIKASHELVKTFDSLVKREEEIPSSRLGQLQRDTHKDEEAILSTISAGRRVAARDIDTMLADRYNEVRGGSDLTREHEQQGRMLLSKGEEDNRGSRDSMGWGNVAADARKAVHKLQRVGLPQIGQG